MKAMYLCPLAMLLPEKELSFAIVVLISIAAICWGLSRLIPEWKARRKLDRDLKRYRDNDPRRKRG